MITDWDDAYANMAHIPGSAELPARWAADAAAFREGHPPRDPELRRPSAPGGRSLPARRPAAWPRGLHPRRLLADDRSDRLVALRRGRVGAGLGRGLPGYVLAPEARISAITRDVARAVARAAEAVDGPIRLSGHSAGGHLAARQVCDDSTLPAPVAARIESVLAISGVHDLRPLLRTRAQRRFPAPRRGRGGGREPGAPHSARGRARPRLGRRRRAPGIHPPERAARQHLDRPRRRHARDGRAGRASLRGARRAARSRPRLSSRPWSGTGPEPAGRPSEVSGAHPGELTGPATDWFRTKV